MLASIEITTELSMTFMPILLIYIGTGIVLWFKT